MHVPLTPLHFKQRAVQLYGQKVGIIDGERRFTYAQFGERSNRLANALLRRGIPRGARVAILAYNSFPLLEAYYGVVEAGAILLPLNIRLGAPDLARIVSHARPELLIADADFAATIEAMTRALERPLPVVWIGQPPAAGARYEELVATGSAAPPPTPDFDENDVAELFYTSGTTGHPRGVMLTHRSLYLHALSMLIAFRASDRDVQLHTIPLFHVNGWGTPQGITAVGGTHVMLRKFEPQAVCHLIEAERVTRLFLVPTMLLALLEHPALHRYDLSSLELVDVGGAPLAPELVRRGEQALGCQVIGGYGLTETGPIVALASDKATRAGEDEQTRIRRQATAGMPLIGVELQIQASEGTALPWDGRSVGEVAIRSNVVTAGYWQDAEATAASFRDGWFLTGDLATVDPEGYALVVDRKKDIIISGGENISSLELERTLAEHPAVLECAVIGAADPRWGEVPQAIVQLRDDAAATADELIAFCRERTSRFKAPKSVTIVTELPRGGTGKVLKGELRKRYGRG